jgi:hypothetical protein
MKKLIKKIIPLAIYTAYRRWKVARFKDKSNKDVFTEIYNTNYWNSAESISGEGSELKQVEVLINELNKLIQERQIKTLLDVPCGDFNWMKKVDLSNVQYRGGDIVEALIKKNIEANKDNDNIRFDVIDLMNDKLPKSDLIVVRDCLVHLSYNDVFKAIENIKKSGSKYLFTTTYPSHKTNYDIVTGDWRKLNLLEKPFNFPKPLLLINEKCTEGNGEFADKSMLLWDISSL